MGNVENFILKVMDDLGFIQLVEFYNCFVVVKDIVEFLLVVKVLVNVIKGEISIVIVYVLLMLSESLLNYMMFYVSVKEIVSIEQLILWNVSKIRIISLCIF